MQMVLVADDQLSAAEAALDALEREALAGYRFEKRRRDWLLGRWAAKLALGAALAVEPARIGIRSEENGHPYGCLDGAPLEGWDVSLTHGHGHAAALAARVPVGIDLELLRDVPPNGWRFFLTPAERAWLAGEPLGPRGEVVAWALKEAAYKAVRGETAGMHHLTLDEVGQGHARIGPGLVGRYRLGQRFCLAIATAERDAALLAGVSWPDDLLLI